MTRPNPKDAYIEDGDPPISTGTESFLEKESRKKARIVEFPSIDNLLGRRIARLMELNPTAGLYWSREDLDQMSNIEKEYILKDFTNILRLMWRHHRGERKERSKEIIQTELDLLQSEERSFSVILEKQDIPSPFKQRIGALHDELYLIDLIEHSIKAPSPFIDLRLTSFWKNPWEIPIYSLGHIFIESQSLYSSVGQAAFMRPSNSGVIPTSIQERTKLIFTETRNGSLVTRMSLGGEKLLFPDESLELRAFRLLQRLLDAGASTEALFQVADGMHSRVFTHYENLLKQLDKEKLGMEINMVSYAKPGVITQAKIRYVDSRKILDKISKDFYTSTLPPFEVKASLQGFKMSSGWFEIKYEDEEGKDKKYSGRTIAGKEILLRGLKGGEEYIFVLRKRLDKEKKTGEIKTTYELLEVKTLS